MPAIVAHLDAFVMICAECGGDQVLLTKLEARVTTATFVRRRRLMGRGDKWVTEVEIFLLIALLNFNFPSE